MNAFPSSVSARKCLRDGDCGEVIYWTLRRTLLINAGLRLAGERKNTLKKSLYASLAVQAFVMTWTATHMDESVASLPSGDAALGGNPVEIAGSVQARERKHLIRNALAGTAAIEIMVLLWAKMENSKS